MNAEVPKKRSSAKKRNPAAATTVEASELAARDLTEVTTLHHAINGAKAVLDALDPYWLRVRVSEFAQIEGSAHLRLVIHPVELAMGRSESQISPRWEGRLWKHNLPRLAAFIQHASDNGVEFDALIRIDLNSRAGLVLVLEGARI
jgi:hypothetical protein